MRKKKENDEDDSDTLEHVTEKALHQRMLNSVSELCFGQVIKQGEFTEMLRFLSNDLAEVKLNGRAVLAVMDALVKNIL